mgnify:CR=1 FL=1
MAAFRKKSIFIKVFTQLYLPSAFTPNGDGLNDFFRIPPGSLNSLSSLVIYDRWGNKVYELLNATNGNVAWDGKNQAGTDCAEGTYYYILKATGKDDKAYEYKGNISLFR